MNAPLDPYEVVREEVGEIMRDHIVIMPAHPHLVSSMVRLDRQAFAQSWPLRELRAFVALSEASIRAPMCHRSLVALEGGRLVGFLLGTLRREESQIHRLAVAASCRRRGIGRRLAFHFLREARPSCSAISFLVRETNLGGLCFLRSIGFRTPGYGALQADAFPDGETGVVLLRQLAAVPFVVQRAE